MWDLIKLFDVEQSEPVVPSWESSEKEKYTSKVFFQNFDFETPSAQ